MKDVVKYIAIAVVVIGISVFYRYSSERSAHEELANLINTQPSSLQADGDLANMFNIGSDYTDLQRENMLKRITGQVVEWKLPVYEVSKIRSGYLVQTSSEVQIGPFGSDVVGSFIYLTPRSDYDRRVIESLKTGDLVTVRARIAGSTLRKLDLRPAILIESTESLTQAANPGHTSHKLAAFGFLEGKPAFQVLEEPLLKAKIDAVLGNALPEFKDRIATSGQIWQTGTWLMGEGNAAHLGGIDEAAFVINSETGDFYAAMLVDGNNVVWFGAQSHELLPAPLAFWVRTRNSK